MEIESWNHVSYTLSVCSNDYPDKVTSEKNDQPVFIVSMKEELVCC